MMPRRRAIHDIDAIMSEIQIALKRHDYEHVRTKTRGGVATAIFARDAIRIDDDFIEASEHTDILIVTARKGKTNEAIGTEIEDDLVEAIIGACEERGFFADEPTDEQDGVLVVNDVLFDDSITISMERQVRHGGIVMNDELFKHSTRKMA